MQTPARWPLLFALLYGLIVPQVGCKPTGPATSAKLTPQEAKERQAVFVKSETEKLAREKGEFETNKQRIERSDEVRKRVAEKLGAVPEIVALPLDRAIRETPESFKEEFALSEQYLAELATASDLNACQALWEKHRTALDQIYQQRYAAEIAAYRQSVLERLEQEAAAGYCVVEIEPPFATFHSLVFALAALVDIASIPADVARGNRPFSNSEHATASVGDLRVIVFPNTAVAADYLALTIFAANGQRGILRDEAAPWKRVASTPDLPEAEAAAQTAAKAMQARYDARKDNDHRKVKVVMLTATK